MMTPRDILLEPHRGAVARLDRIREDVLATEFAPRARSTFRRNFATILAFKIWSEIIRPARHAWAGLAAAWLGLAMIHVMDRGAGDFAGGVALTPPAVRSSATWGEQKHLLTLTFASPPQADDETPAAGPPAAKAKSLLHGGSRLAGSPSPARDPRT